MMGQVESSALKTFACRWAKIVTLLEWSTERAQSHSAVS